MQTPDLPPKPIILVVDDTPENIDILVRILETDYHLRVAPNGEQALRIAALTPPPDLILLDVIMPGLSGYEVCRELKSAPGTAGIPVIFVTAMDDPQDELRGFELGAVDYVTKPFDPLVVLARVRACLKK
ncbi:MAG: response regulator [Candidatus Latescibacteria bacterium]|nr:response regulator [Candidatus Latescibacterota bacterium]